MGHERRITDAQNEAPKARSFQEISLKCASSEKTRASANYGYYGSMEKGHVSSAYRAGIMTAFESTSFERQKHKALVVHTLVHAVSPARVTSIRDEEGVPLDVHRGRAHSTGFPSWTGS